MDFDLWQLPLVQVPKTVNPAKLHIGASPEPEATPGHILKRKSHPIPRICSEWGDGLPDWKRDFRMGIGYRALPKPHIYGWQELYMKYLSWEYQIPIDVPLDPLAEVGATVVASIRDNSVSIYDAYLLKVDIAKNENEFRRYQVVYTPQSDFYTVISRRGRVGLMGESFIMEYSIDLDVAVRKFEEIFRICTGYSWDKRYSLASQSPLLRDTLKYVDLDYTFPTNNDLLFLQPPKESPKSDLDNFNAKFIPNKPLMEDILFGGPTQTCAPIAAASRSDLPGTTPSPFTAPRQYLSLWTVTKAFITLQAIAFYLEPKPNKPSTIRWETIMRTSVMYRNIIPFYGGWFNSDRPPVICNYHAILIELEFLHSLCPGREEITSLMNDMKDRVMAQEKVRGQALATQPLYQAYSSLRHGFRLLTDTSSLEFQQLRNYLEESCQTQFHHMAFQLQGIYRVFRKANLPNPYRHWIQFSTGNNNTTTSSSQPSRLLLWHGTPLPSLLGILEHGLQIRKRQEVPLPRSFRRPGKNHPPLLRRGLVPGVINTSRNISAARRIRTGLNQRYTRPGMFGDGIYLADASSKSAGYCQALTTSEGEAVLLLCEADVGDEGRRIRTYHSLPDGHDVVGEFGGEDVRCIEGVGRTGPRRMEDGGWKRVGWDMDGGGPGGMQRGDGRDVWMPDTSEPYAMEYRNATLLFNEYVLFNPAHVQIRYIFRLKIKQTDAYW